MLDINTITRLFQDMTGSQDQINAANTQLMEIKNHPDAWTLADQLIDKGSMANIRFFGISILKHSIQTRWSLFSEEERQSLREFLVSRSISWATSGENEANLTQINLALVYCVILDWPQRWPNIMDDIISSAQSSSDMTNNNLMIINLLSQEVMEFNENLMTSGRQSQLTNALQAISPEIFNLLSYVLTNSSEERLIKTSLKTLESLVRWLDPQYIFENVLLRDLCETMLPNPLFKMNVLSIFGEIASIPSLSERYNQDIPLIFEAIINSLSETLIDGLNYDDFFMDEPDFVKVLIVTLSNFIIKYRISIEKSPVHLHKALIWLIGFHNVEQDSFRVLCDLWANITQEIYVSESAAPIGFYDDILSQVRRILIRKMERPSEVLIVEDEFGKVIRDSQPDTLARELYRLMRDALVCLTNIDYSDTIKAIDELYEEMNENWSTAAFNCMCWSAGSVSGAIPAHEESAFVLHILTQLLQMQSEDPEKQSVIASGIMFIFSQYPRFLAQRRNLLNIVLEHLITFMQHDSEGIREMAVDTFRTLAKKCPRSFIVRVSGQRSLLEEQLANFDSMSSMLSPDLIVSLYDSFSLIIKSITEEGEKASIISESLMSRTNSMWYSYLNALEQPNFGNWSEILYLLKNNEAVVSNVGWSYHSQFTAIFPDLINLFSTCTSKMNQIFAQRGDNAIHFEDFKTLCGINSAICQITSLLVSDCKINNRFLATSIWPNVLSTFVAAYPDTYPGARVSNVLSVLRGLAEKSADTFRVNWPTIFTSVIGPTIEMIKDNFEDHINFRIEFISLLKAVIENCKEAIYSMGPEDELFVYMMGAIQWCVRHPVQQLCLDSIKLTSTLFAAVSTSRNDQFKNRFLARYFMEVLTLAFEVLTDTVHKFAFTETSRFIKRMMTRGIIWEEPQVIAERLCALFERPPEDFLYFSNLVDNLMQTSSDISLLRDFVIQVKQYAIYDPDLFAEENRDRLAEIEKTRKAIPGMQGENREEDLSAFLD